ncbi:hypothetical protein LAD74_02265 [Mycoplasma sp. U97]|uniref:hypothetical protein n=1 Tax=Mycoplasma tauri TaxID=547987 RepID=UPI001CC01FC1|nr:hypothetical protein [Mycoplasma tauri]MBZ4212802.1 hypothetical protein [Mycoplasma tauri]
MKKARKILNFKKSETPFIINSLSNNEIIYLVDKNHKKEIYPIFQNILSWKPKISLTSDDIYNEFLYMVPKYTKKYQYNPNSSFGAYICKVAKNFCLNKIQYWTRKKRKIDSEMISNEEFYSLPDKTSEDILNENIDNIDISNFLNVFLTEEEKQNTQMLINYQWTPYTKQKINEIRLNLIKKMSIFYNNSNY